MKNSYLNITNRQSVIPKAQELAAAVVPSLILILFYVSLFCLGSSLSKCTLDSIGKYSHRDSAFYEKMAEKYPINKEVQL